MSDPYQSPASLPATAPHVSGLSAEERNWAMIAHLSPLAGLLTGGLGNILGPLVVWLIKKDTMPFAAQEAKEALNFQITWTVAAIVLAVVGVPLCLVLVGIPIIIVAILLPIISFVLCIIAGIGAGEGKPYRYPMTLRLVK